MPTSCNAFDKSSIVKISRLSCIHKNVKDFPVIIRIQGHNFLEYMEYLLLLIPFVLDNWGLSSLALPTWGIRGKTSVRLPPPKLIQQQKLFMTNHRVYYKTMIHGMTQLCECIISRNINLKQQGYRKLPTLTPSPSCSIFTLQNNKIWKTRHTSTPGLYICLAECMSQFLLTAKSKHNWIQKVKSRPGLYNHHPRTYIITFSLQIRHHQHFYSGENQFSYCNYTLLAYDCVWTTHVTSQKK